MIAGRADRRVDPRARRPRRQRHAAGGAEPPVPIGPAPPVRSDRLHVPGMTRIAISDGRRPTRALQAPLKERYRAEPDAALVTLSATGDLGEGVSCSVHTARAVAEAGLHPATGGDGSLLCSGDMLLEALVACAGVTLRAVVDLARDLGAIGPRPRRGRSRLPRDARRRPRRAGRVQGDPAVVRARDRRRRTSSSRR